MITTHISLKIAKIVFAFLFISGFSACSNSVLFDQNKDIDQTWSKSENIIFDIDVKDTIQKYNFLVNIRNSTEYRFSNLYFFMKTTFPNGQMAIDTVECNLADNNGKWLGEGLGKYRDLQILLKRNGRFPISGKYKIEIEQATREYELSGIKSMGIRIERFKKDK